MTHKRNVVLYPDAELVRKTREFGFNLSKTCETHFKHVITTFQNANTANTRDSWWAGPDLNQRTSARQALMGDRRIDWVQFRTWLKNKYAKTWSPTVFCYAKKYHEMLNGDFIELEAFSKSARIQCTKQTLSSSRCFQQNGLGSCNKHIESTVWRYHNRMFRSENNLVCMLRPNWGA